MTTTITKSLPGVETGEEKQVQAPAKKAEQKSTPVSATDSFVSASNEKIDPEKDGQFTFKQAGKNFLLGLIAPIKAMIAHPFMTAATVLGFAALGLIVGTGAMQFIGIGLFLFGGVTAVYEFGKGGYKFINSAIKGDKDEMENAFKDVGAGISGVVMTMSGVRNTAKFVAEAKAVGRAIRAGENEISAIKKGQAATAGLDFYKIKGCGVMYKHIPLIEALKESFSIFTKDGLYGLFKSIRLARVKKNYLRELKAGYEASTAQRKKYVYHRTKIVPDKDVRDLSKCIGLDENSFRDIVLMNLKQDELLWLREQCKLARNVSDKEIISIVRSAYDREIPKIARRVGVDENKLRKLLPNVKSDKKAKFPGAVCPLGGINYSINPDKVRYSPIIIKLYLRNKSSVSKLPLEIFTKFSGTIKEFATDIGYHEPKHIEQALLCLKNLTAHEYMAQVGKSLNYRFTGTKTPRGLGKRALGILGTALGRLIGFLDYVFFNAPYIRGLKVSPGAKDIERARLLSNSFTENVLAHGPIRAGSGFLYINLFIELEARMQAALRRVQELFNMVKLPNANKHTIKNSLFDIGRELRYESGAFTKPPTTELQEQNREVK